MIGWPVGTKLVRTFVPTWLNGIAVGDLLIAGEARGIWWCGQEHPLGPMVGQPHMNGHGFQEVRRDSEWAHVYPVAWMRPLDADTDESDRRSNRILPNQT